MRFPSYLELDDKIKINEVIHMADKQKKTNPDEEFLQDLYKNACMGTDSVTTVLGKTKDEKLRCELTAQLDGYQNFANTTRNKLSGMSSTAKEISAFAKIPAEISIMMSTMVDNSTSKIAEMMINGSTMGVIDLKKRVKQAEQDGVSEEVVKIANDMMTFEEDNIDKMKNYL